jgi:putative membrane protein
MLLLVITHAVGVMGLNNNLYHHFFESIASVNLLFSFLMVIIFDTYSGAGLLWFSVFGFVLGMGAEVTGVNTGLPFGVYYYTPSFGWHVLGVPVIIGINWVLLSYITGVVVSRHLKAGWQKIMAAAALMVAIDLLLEDFAIRHNLWVWQNGTPPLQNYVAWFMIALIMQFGYQKLIPKSSNPNALAYLIILTLFLFADRVIAICG